MTTDPVILILEDERSQILTLRSQLAGMGRLVEFMDPEPALDYAREHACDAAIVDVRMPRAPMDGLGFLRALRQFDKDLAIIIRTASESDQVADGAIELRAIKRAVKSKTTLAELRRSTAEAIQETRQRREMARQVRDTQATQTKLVEALGAYDLRLAAADLHRGLIHSLRNQLTALSALASVIKGDAAASGGAAFRDHARRAEDLVARMVDTVNTFLDGPFGDGTAAGGAGVNLCLGALGQFFLGVDRWSSEGKRLAVRDLLSDTRVDCAPLELINGLRHLVEFFFLHCRPESEVSLVAAIVHSGGQIAEKLGQGATVLNREVVRPQRPYVSFRASAALPEANPEEVGAAFSFRPESGRTGNLHVLGQMATAAKGAVAIARSPAGVLSVDVLLPLAL